MWEILASYIQLFSTYIWINGLWIPHHNTLLGDTLGWTPSHILDILQANTKSFQKSQIEDVFLNTTMNLNENTSTTSTIFKLVLSTSLQFPSKFKFSGFDVELQLLFLF